MCTYWQRNHSSSRRKKGGRQRGEESGLAMHQRPQGGGVRTTKSPPLIPLVVEQSRDYGGVNKPFQNVRCRCKYTRLLNNLVIFKITYYYERNWKIWSTEQDPSWVVSDTCFEFFFFVFISFTIFLNFFPVKYVI